MKGKKPVRTVPGVAFVNLQKPYVVHTAPLLAFVRGMKRSMRLEKCEFNICFVDDSAIRHLNLAHRGKDKATDVLSFPWREAGEAHSPAPSAPSHGHRSEGFANFLGDVVISVETARRNAAMEGHSTLNEIRWLILHGVLHLLGYDHEHDSGEMIALELALREKLEVAGGASGEKMMSNGKMRRSKVRTGAV